MADVTIAAEAAQMVADLQAHLQPTLEQQAREPTPPPPLEQIIMNSFDANPEVFESEKKKFTMIPPPIQEQIFREVGFNWRDSRFLDTFINRNTRHLSLKVYRHDIKYNRKKDLGLTCSKIVEKCKTLRSLEVTLILDEYCGCQMDGEKEEECERVSLPQLCLMLEELHSLTEFHLRTGDNEAYIDPHVINPIVFALTWSKSDLEVLTLPNITVYSRNAILARWKNFKVLNASSTNFILSDLRKMGITVPWLMDEVFKSKFLLMHLMAMIYHPQFTGRPYHVGGSFSCRFMHEKKGSSLSSEDMVNLFNAFPRVNGLIIREADVAAVCAGLEGTEHEMCITKIDVGLESSNPRAIEPLLAIVGGDLRELRVRNGEVWETDQTNLDVAMVGHYCPHLEVLRIMDPDKITAGEAFEITDTTFSHLKRLWMRKWDFCDINLPDPLVCRLLGGPMLEDVNLWGLVISQAVLDYLMAGQGERRPLKSVKVLSVFYTMASVGIFANLMARMPRLKKLLLRHGTNVIEPRVERLTRLYVTRLLGEFRTQSGLKARIFRSRVVL